MPTFHRCIFCSPGSEPAWDQPNRAVRTRMLRGVGGAPCEGRSYPDGLFCFSGRSDFIESLVFTNLHLTGIVRNHFFK